MHKRIICILLFLFIVPVCFAQQARGINKFYKIEEGFYRGGYPTQEGLRYLKQLGVKTIIDLRKSGIAAVKEERKLAEPLGIKYINIPFGFFKKPPKDEDIKMFLAIVSSQENRPAFVHCHSGRDRTGMMVAAYRIAAQGWPKEKAYKEARDLGFHPFYLPMRNFILNKAERFKIIREEKDRFDHI